MKRIFPGNCLLYSMKTFNTASSVKLQLLLSIYKSYAHSYNYQSKHNCNQHHPYIYGNHWLIIALTHQDLLFLFWEPFPFTLHELCWGNIFSFHLCNKPLASFRFHEKHDLLSSFLASWVMEKLWVDLILQYYTQQFHFTQDTWTASHLCTSYQRTSDSLSHTNPASTLVPQHHSHQTLFLTLPCLKRVLFQCKQNCSKDSQTSYRKKTSLCRIWLSCWICTAWNPLYLSTRGVLCLWQHVALTDRKFWTYSPNAQQLAQFCKAYLYQGR